MIQIVQTQIANKIKTYFLAMTEMLAADGL